MIDFARESILTLNQAAETLPRRRRGRKVHVATLYRWTSAGCRGVLLEAVQIGATRCTSMEALGRFFERLSAEQLPSSSPVPQKSLATRTLASEKAALSLEKLGA